MNKQINCLLNTKMIFFKAQINNKMNNSLNQKMKVCLASRCKTNMWEILNKAQLRNLSNSNQESKKFNADQIITSQQLLMNKKIFDEIEQITPKSENLSKAVQQFISYLQIIIDYLIKSFCILQ